jgi:hypothetical protein
VTTLVPTDRVKRDILTIRGRSFCRRLEALEQKYDAQNAQIQEIFAAIRALMEPPPGVARRRISFRPNTAKDRP